MKVLSASIVNDSVTYNMVWYDGNTRNTAYIGEFEITEYETKDLRTIGFQ